MAAGAREIRVRDDTQRRSPYHQKKEGVYLRHEEALWSNVGPPSTSPQCQPTTHAKEKDLDRIERLSTMVILVSQVEITGRKCR